MENTKQEDIIEPTVAIMVAMDVLIGGLNKVAANSATSDQNLLDLIKVVIAKVNQLEQRVQSLELAENE